MDLRVARGEIYAFLGLNGAGKSTTIRMLLGMVAPTAGDAALFGEPVRAEARGLWRRVGHLVETATAYPELTVRDNLEVARRLQGVTDRRAVGRVMEQLAWAPTPTAAPGRCRSATCSGWRWPAPCSTRPSCWSSTSPPTASIRPASSRSGSCCARWRATGA